MDTDKHQHLLKGLQAHIRKGAMIGEPSKRTKVDNSSSVMPAAVVADSLVTTIATKVATPLTSINPLIEVPTSESPTKRVMEVEKKKKKEKLAIVMVRCRVATRGSNGFDEDLGENPFNNKDIIKKLVDGCTLPKVIDRIVEVDPELHT